MTSFDKLVDIIATLRGDGGCHWDKEQTIESIKPCLIEETYEVVDAIMENDKSALKEELGDLLLQVVFLSQICAEEGEFTVDDVANAICEKLIRRHPHVFGDSSVSSSKEILSQWEDIKKEEQKEKGKERKSVLDGVPKSLPEMTKSLRMHEKASRVGFDYEHIDDAFAKIEEELNEVADAYKNSTREHTEEEIGDLLTVVLNFSRLLKIDPEIALHRSNNKFKSRFGHIEESAAKMNKNLKDMSVAEMEELWQESKRLEKQNKK